MRFLDGFKTALGIIGLVVVGLADAQVLPLLPERSRPYVTGAAAMLTVLGLVHKLEKAQDRKRDDAMHAKVMERLREDAEKDGREEL